MKCSNLTMSQGNLHRIVAPTIAAMLHATLEYEIYVVITDCVKCGKPDLGLKKHAYSRAHTPSRDILTLIQNVVKVHSYQAQLTIQILFRYWLHRTIHAVKYFKNIWWIEDASLQKLSSYSKRVYIMQKGGTHNTFTGKRFGFQWCYRWSLGMDK